MVTQNEPRLALPRLARRLLTIALLVFMLGGMITSPLDVAILLAALGGAGPLARLVLRIRLLNTILGTIPIAVRFVLGCFLALAVANAVTSINIYPWPSDFFPVVVATALDVLIFVILLGAWREPIQRMAVSRTPGTTVKTLVLAISLAVLWLGLPEQVYADNCSSLDDQCSAGPPGCTSAAAAALAAGYAWWKGHNKGDRDPNTDDTEGDDDSIPESCPK